MPNYKNLEIYKEAKLMSKELRESIVKVMPRYYRFDVGDEMKQLLRDIKYKISVINSLPNNCKYQEICLLINQLEHLEIMIDECLEDGSLSISGRYNIIQPLGRLENIMTQATKWRDYVYDKSKKSVSC